MVTDPRTTSDYWTLPHRPDGSTDMPLHHDGIEVVAEVQPLGPQFGVDPKLCVPEILRDQLFGQPEAYTGAPLRTYALLDAARIENLPEQLEGSDLECRCLFIGDALAKMSGVAPWLVRLQEHNRFTRKLFSEGEPPQGLWNCDGGIFLRSTQSLDAVWRHLRRFVRVRDTNGKWFYYRFWEPKLMLRYMQELAGDGQRAAMWSRHRDTLVISALIACDTARQTCKVLDLSGSGAAAPSGEFRLGQPEYLTFAAHQRDGFLDRLSIHLSEKCETFAALPDAAQRQACKDRLAEAQKFGLKSEQAVAQFALAFVVSDGRIRADRRSRAILGTANHELDRARALLDHARTLREPAT